MKLRARLRRLEDQVGRASSPEEDNLREEDWLEFFTAWGQAGQFAHEPDFPEALAGYRAALTQAQAQTDPPFDPPPDYRPTLTDRQRWRLWRNEAPFAEVRTSFLWLLAMLKRLREGVPPVSAAEFAELANWFAAHESPLYQWSQPSQLLDVGAGRVFSVADLRYRVRQGVRVLDAGRCAEDLRRLRARYGSEPVRSGTLNHGEYLPNMGEDERREDDAPVRVIARWDWAPP